MNLNFDTTPGTLRRVAEYFAASGQGGPTVPEMIEHLLDKNGYDAKALSAVFFLLIEAGMMTGEDVAAFLRAGMAGEEGASDE